MSPELLISAFLAAARKQRLITPGQARALRPRLASAGLRTLRDLRAWLPANGGLPTDLLGPLLQLLPSDDGGGFAPYRALAHLASGGMGEIWLAASTAGGLVVVKTLVPHLRTTAGSIARDSDGEVWIDDAGRAPSDSPGTDPVARLERETRITRSLDHANIVRCLDHGLGAGDQAFLVLEYMADGDLKDLLEDHGPLPEALALSIARQVAAALEAAHRQQILHRDVKPGNIFLSLDGHAKLADFGFARSNRANHTQLTMAGSVLGSPLYMAPEQITADAALDVRCDLYGLGCVLFHCLTGAPPYTGGIHQVLRAHCVAAIPDVRRGRPEISATTAALVTRLLAKDPSGRLRDPTATKLAIIEAMAGVHLRPDQLVPLPARDSDTRPVRPGTTVDLDLRAVAEATENLRTGQPAAPTPPPRRPAANDDPTHPLPVGGQAPTPPPAAAPAVVATSPTPDGWDGDWLTLRGPGDIQVSLWARPRVVAGKLRGPGVDLCLRNYPEEVHREACIRISRAHIALELDHRGAAVTDLGSANGTLLDGAPVTAQRRATLTAGVDHRLDIAQTVQLRLRTVTGLDGTPEALIAARPANRPGLTYALVADTVIIGDPGADVVVPGAGGRCQVRRNGGRWQRRGADAVWLGLAPGDRLDAGGVPLTVHAGSPDDL